MDEEQKHSASFVSDGEKKFNVVLHPSELQHEHSLLESLLLTKKKTRAKLLATMTLLQYVLITKLLLMLVYKKRECSNQQMVKAFNFRKRFIWRRVCSKEKIRLFLRSKTKMTKFWERLNTFLPQVISCYITLLPRAERETSNRENQLSEKEKNAQQPSAPHTANITSGEKKNNKISGSADSSDSVFLVTDKNTHSAGPIVDDTAKA